MNDLYMEHALHPKPYWKTMKDCSECYRLHNEIVAKSNYHNYSPAQEKLDKELDYHLTPSWAK